MNRSAQLVTICLAWLLGLAAACVHAAPRAQAEMPVKIEGPAPTVANVPPQQIAQQTLELVKQFTPRSVPRMAGGEQVGEVAVQRIEVALGQADGRLRLSPCEEAVVFVPATVKLWGRSRIGLRCERGASRWSITLPITVKAYGQGVVPIAALPPGTAMAAGDLRIDEVDLAAESAPAVLSLDDAVGRQLMRGLAPGASLRTSYLKPRRYFAAGDPVRLVVRGSGFSVNGEGQALVPGEDGQCARIRTEGGRVICARPIGDRLAEVGL